MNSEPTQRRAKSRTISYFSRLIARVSLLGQHLGFDGQFWQSAFKARYLQVFNLAGLPFGVSVPTIANDPGFVLVRWSAPIADNGAAITEYVEKEVYEELGKFGEVDELHVVDNLGEHMIGHVYAKYFNEEDAVEAQKKMNGRFYWVSPAP